MLTEKKTRNLLNSKLLKKINITSNIEKYKNDMYSLIKTGEALLKKMKCKIDFYHLNKNDYEEIKNII